MATDALSWPEVRQMMAQLEQLCATSADQETMQTLKRSRIELQDVFMASETNAKKAILELQRSVATERAAASELQTPLEQLSSQLEGLASKKGQLAAHIASMQQLKDTSAGAMQQLLAQTLQYKDMLAALQKDQGAQLPRTQHFLTLYAIISSIKWNYDSPAIEGFLAPPNGAPVRPFRLEPTLPSTTVADHLWDAVAMAHGIPVPGK